MRLLLAVAFAFQNTLAMLLCRIPHHAHYRVQLRERAASLIKSHEGEVIDKLSEEFERTLIEVALTDTAGRKKEAAEKLGWGRNTLTRKLKELGFAEADITED